MNEIENILKEKPIVLPRYLFNYYLRLGITPEELIILIFIMDKGNKVIYNPLELSEELGMDKFKVMELLNSLNEKKIISITVEKENNKSEEYISLELLYKKIANILIEKEFGRTISSMECQIIKGWIDDGFSHELIMEALKEAIYNGVTSLRYIEKILYEWRKKGYKNKKDIQEAKEKYRESKKETKDYFFYDWINDD